jgi:hypothetical protein
MIHFENDDEGYRRWLEANQEGFVINRDSNRPRPFLRLHQAPCGSIRSEKIGNYTTTRFVKDCSLDKRELEIWARERFGIDVRRCKNCGP